MALFLECTQLCARSALRKYLTKPALLEMAGYVGQPDTGSELKTPCASRVLQPRLQMGYVGSFMRAGNSSFSPS